jgi:YidC/Oxa1 family membrane protein insertase
VGISDFINVVFTQPIFNILMLLYHLFGDFGLSIIVLTIIVRLALFPLTLKQLKSAKIMQELQPEINRIREKFRDDPRAQFQAQQELYKEYNVKPYTSGCLPLLLQFPFLYGLYFAFRAVLDDAAMKASQGLEHLNGFIYPFLPKFSHFPDVSFNWFTFINSSWHFSLALPDPTHVLPILAALATFIQLRLSQVRSQKLAASSADKLGQTRSQKLAATSSKRNDTSDPLAVQQQTMQIMTYMMPVMTLFLAWNFPAGLALYWTTGSVFMAVQQYLVTGTLGPLKPTILARQPQGPRSDPLLEEEKIEAQDELPAAASGVRPLRNGSASTRRRLRSASARRRGTIPRRNPTRG